ncbi:MAG: hypothetical protein A2Y38_23755 [Spirochaetes bacterium GWB1_59_5]|nr:MAG: hypothetical protein A2Y38_23755 [Spirochaetes bacterium GWB1_59_5]
MHNMYVDGLTKIGNALGLKGQFLGEFGFDQIMNIITPEPEMETLELTRYFTISEEGCIMGTYETEADAEEYGAAGTSVVRVSGSYQRVKKQPVEKSVSVRIDGNGYVHEVVKEGPTEHLTTFKHRNTQGVYVFTE